MAQHDYKDYDRYQHAVSVNTFARLREVVGEQQGRKSNDSRVTLIAKGLQTAKDADPDALGGLDPWYWAGRIVAETNWG